MLSMLRTLAFAASLAALLGACSWFKPDEPEFFGSEDTRPLEIPEDLDAPNTSGALVVAQADVRMPTVDELEPRPPRVIVTSAAGEEGGPLRWSSEGVYLLVDDTPESVARRLRFVIPRSGMRLVEQDPSGAHRFEYTHLTADDGGMFDFLLFWRDDPPDYSGAYRVRLAPDGEQTRIYLVQDNGGPADPDAVEHVLQKFATRLG